MQSARCAQKHTPLNINVPKPASCMQNERTYLPTPTHAHILTRTHIRYVCMHPQPPLTHMHMYTYTYMHTHTHAYTHSQTNTHTHYGTCMYTGTQTHTHIRTHKYTNRQMQCTCRFKHTYNRTQLHTHAHARTCTRTNVHTRTHMRTHTCRRTQTPRHLGGHGMGICKQAALQFDCACHECVLHACVCVALALSWHGRAKVLQRPLRDQKRVAAKVLPQCVQCCWHIGETHACGAAQWASAAA